MTENGEIIIHNSQKETKVDFHCLIQSAVRQDISWKTLIVFLTDLTTTLETSMEVIKILVEELEIWVAKAKSGVNTVRDNSSINEISIENFESDQITLTSTPVKNNSQNEGLVNLESEDEVIVLDLESSGKSNQTKHDIAEVKEAEVECKEITASDNKSEPNIDHEKLKNFYEFIGDNKKQVAKPSMKEKNQCKTCGKLFSRILLLRRHEQIHSGEKPFQCKTCLKSFTQSNSLTIHTRIHNGEKPFKCKKCNATFSQSGTMYRHERSHTGDKPFKCQSCPKAFAEAAKLTIHKRTHAGEKPYSCKTCNASFTQSGSLKAHERIHNRIEYKCKNCDASFTRFSNLKNIKIFINDFHSF